MNEQQIASSLHISFEKRFGPEFFKRIPARAGVFWMLDRKRHLLLVGKTQNLFLRLMSFRDALPLFCSKRELDLVNQIHEMNWTECENLSAAHLIEKEIIARKSPLYKFAQLDLKNFYYLNFQCSSEHFLAQISNQPKEEFQTFGAFKGLVQGRQFLASFLRLIWFSMNGSHFNTWPLHLTKPLAPQKYAFQYKRISDVEMWNWQQCFESYFMGQSPLLLKKLLHKLNNEVTNLDKFSEGWLLQDLSNLEKFYLTMCSKSRVLRQKLGLKTEPLSPEWLEPFKISLR